MGSEWKELELNELSSDITVGFVGSMSKLFVDSGVPLLRGQNILPYKLDLENLKYISTETHAKWKKSALKAGDVVLVRVGHPGTACVIPEGMGDLNAASLVIVRPNPNKLDSHFLCYFLNSPHGKTQIFNYLVGSVQQVFNVKTAAKLKVSYPELPIQKSIAHILGALDEKIELNRQMNATLEAMAQALFKSWFVDFDPVIDNALATGNPIPEPLQARVEARKALGDKRKPLPEGIQQQFPSSFVFSEEMGWVPDGWEVKSLGDIVELAYGKSLPATKRIDGDIPVFGSGGISGFHNEKLVDGPGIIVGRKGTVGSLYWVEDDFFPIDTVFYVVNKLHAPLYWLYQMLGTIDIKSMGADSAVPGVNRNALYARGVTIPNAGVFDGYLKQIESYNSQRKILDGQASTISKLRDTLLPKLLSGQLRIPEAEKQIAEAI